MRVLNSALFSDSADHIDSEGSWAVSYGDMVTLLLCFFILFFTIDPKKEKSDQLQVGLMSVMAAKSTSSKNKSEVNGINEDLANKWNGVAYKSKNRILIEFPGISFFKSGQVDITPTGKVALLQFVAKYIPYAGSYQVDIRAFTDLKKVRKKRNARFRDNVELSALRSVSAMRVLQNSGVPLNRIRLGGYGEHVTTANELDVARKANPEASHRDLDLARKVVLVIQPDGENVP